MVRPGPSSRRPARPQHDGEERPVGRSGQKKGDLEHRPRLDPPDHPGDPAARSARRPRAVAATSGRASAAARGLVRGGPRSVGLVDATRVGRAAYRAVGRRRRSPTSAVAGSRGVRRAGGGYRQSVSGCSIVTRRVSRAPRPLGSGLAAAVRGARRGPRPGHPDGTSTGASRQGRGAVGRPVGPATARPARVDPGQRGASAADGLAHGRSPPAAATTRAAPAASTTPPPPRRRPTRSQHWPRLRRPGTRPARRGRHLTHQPAALADRHPDRSSHTTGDLDPRSAGDGSSTMWPVAVAGRGRPVVGGPAAVGGWSSSSACSTGATAATDWPSSRFITRTPVASRPCDEMSRTGMRMTTPPDAMTKISSSSADHERRHDEALAGGELDAPHALAAAALRLKFSSWVRLP